MSHRYNVLLRNFVKIASKAAESEERFLCAFKGSGSLLHDIERVSVSETTIDGSVDVELFVVGAARGAEEVKTIDNTGEERNVVCEIKKKQDNYRGRRRVKSCLEKGSKKRQRKHESQQLTSIIPPNTCPTSAHVCLSISELIYLLLYCFICALMACCVLCFLQGTYNIWMTPMQYSATYLLNWLPHVCL